MVAKVDLSSLVHSAFWVVKVVERHSLEEQSVNKTTADLELACLELEAVVGQIRGLALGEALVLFVP